MWSYYFEMSGTVAFNPNTFLDRFLSFAVVRTQALWFALAMVALVFWTSLRREIRSLGLLTAAGLLAMSVVMTVAMLAHSSWYNANIPMLTALAVFLPSLVSAAAEGIDSARDGVWSPLAWAYLAIALFVLTNPYNPNALIPTAEDRRAGDALVAYLRSKPGPVFVPSHPTFTWLAGKPDHIHYSPVMEWRRAGRGLPEDLAEAVRRREYSAIVLDSEDEFTVDATHSVELGDLIRANYVKDPAMAGWSGADLVPVVGGKRRPRVFLIPRGDVRDGERR